MYCLTSVSLWLEFPKYTQGTPPPTLFWSCFTWDLTNTLHNATLHYATLCRFLCTVCSVLGFS